MKGFIFDEFLQMVEKEHGLSLVNTIIEGADLPSGGAYTTVGTYDFNEMLALVTQLSAELGVPTGKLLHHFGHYLFQSLTRAHADVIQNYSSPLSLVSSIEDHIHIHVKKLYPNAELPSFKILYRTENKLKIIYTSSRGLYALAHGLMEGAFLFFDEEVEVDYKLLKEDGTQVEFMIRHLA